MPILPSETALQISDVIAQQPLTEDQIAELSRSARPNSPFYAGLSEAARVGYRYWGGPDVGSADNALPHGESFPEILPEA